MKIESKQQIGWKEDRFGNRRKQVFDLDKVYAVDETGERVEYLGHCYRSTGVLHPHRDFTHEEKVAVVEQLNAIRAEQGLAPLERVGDRPLSIAEVNAKVEQIQRSLRGDTPQDDDDE